MRGLDEWTYAEQGRVLRDRGIRRGFRLLAERFLADPEIQHFPSPVRWLWILLLRFERAELWSAVFAVQAAFLAAPTWAGRLLAGASPLLWQLGRRGLQDTTVAALTLVALQVDHVPGLAVAVLALLATKEAAVLALPAVLASWWLRGLQVLPGLAGIAAGTLAALLAARLLLGRKAGAVLVTASRGHDTDYTRLYQSGPPHRLIVDLAFVSPIPLLLATRAAPTPQLLAAVVLAAAHLVCSPIQNVRILLALDLSVRAAVATLLPIWAFVPILLVDAWTAWRLRTTYDPTTHALGQALGVLPTPHRTGG